MSVQGHTLLSVCKRGDPQVEAVEYIASKKHGLPGWYGLYVEKNRSPMFIGGTYSECLINLSPKNENLPIVTPEEINTHRSSLLSLKLKGKQLSALEMIMDVASGRMVVAKLVGYAGTGKTTVIQRASVDLKLSGKRVAYCAPTNQAVKVLRKKLPGEVCLTIHSLLGLKVKKERGEKILVKAGKSQLKDFDLIIIDECSMLGVRLMEMIYENFYAAKHTSILFAGDKKQLNPVGEDASLSFDVKNGIELVDIVRQAEGNPILENTKRLRRMRSFSFDKLAFTEDETAEEGFFKLRITDWNPHIKEMFTSKNFDTDDTYVRVLAWTNDRVALLNKQIHEYRHGKTATPWIVGEKVLAKEPIGDGLIKNSEECELLEIEDFHLHGFPCWFMLLKSEESGTRVPCYVVKDEAKGEYADKLEILAKKNDWARFYDIADDFVDVQHNYAITCHRSQGSTFDNVIIDASDILRNSLEEELLRMMYVATSRPRFRCWIK